MKKLLNPKWIFIANTLPVVILLILEWNEFSVIKHLLSDSIISRWGAFAIVLSILAIGNILYAVTQLRKRKRIELAYSIISFIVHLIFVLSYYLSYDDMRGIDTPRWMGASDGYLYVGAFLMPTLLYTLFNTVILLTPRAKDMQAWMSFLCAIAVPVLFYILAIMVIPIWNGSSGDNFFLIFLTIGVIVFLFFIIRFIYILMSKKNIRNRYSLLWKIPVSLIFPLIGLCLNTSMDNIFGDFSDPFFYIGAVLNALFICLPPRDNYTYRLFLYIGRSITFVYTLYFFFVMMPYLPFSILAIIIFGAGLLMLTPLALFMIHINELSGDFKYLRKKFKSLYLYTAFILSLLVMPAFLTLSYIGDKEMVHKTLEYLYSADYNKEYKLNSRSVLRTLSTVDDRTTNSFFSNSSVPYLSGFYKWLVLDNMNISGEKKRMMHNLFEGTKYSGRDRSTINSVQNTVDINITDIKHISTYDSKENVWISQIDLTIKNENTPLWNAEYKTQFDLPVGCWISDYYLYVGDVKEMGILAEKKAATWVFNSIRNINRDPGLLSYIGGNKIEFKVFPFQKQEVRYTGIEFVHKEPVEIEIDGHLLILGNTDSQTNMSTTVNKDGVVYISAEDKDKLATVNRTPYYHFIVDVSANESNYRTGDDVVSVDKKSGYANRYIQSINKLLDRNLIGRDHAKISYTNTYVETSALNSGWESDLKSKSFEGGFFLDRAVKKILFDNYKNCDQTYPVIVVVSNSIEKAIVYDNFGDIKFTYPESELFYSLKNDTLKAHTFSGGLKVVDENVTYIDSPVVKAWPSLSNTSVYLPDDKKSSILISTKEKALKINPDEINSKNWESGLIMQGQWMLQTLYPETADAEWLNLIQNSFKSRFMSPLTSYIVVETQAQKIALMKKQEEALSGNRSLDLTDDTRRMSEPDLYILVIALWIFFCLHKWRKRRKSINK